MTYARPGPGHTGTLVTVTSRAPLPVASALALRRLAVAGGALGATVVAHCLAVGDLTLMPVAPAAWLGLLAMAMVVGPRVRFRPRGVLRTFVLMFVLQTVAHVAMSVAPWAAGLAPHHAAGVEMGAVAVAAHAGAALILAVAIAGLERMLHRAVGMVTAVRRWLAAPARRRTARHARVAWPENRMPARPAPTVRCCRGPPIVRSV